MTTITDDYMKQMLTSTRSYTAVLLIKAPAYFNRPDARQIVWEHGRRNFSLRADGSLSIVCPVLDDSDKAGIAIFQTGIEETKKIMEADPGVVAGIFTYEVHPVKSFPGDSLPA